MVSWYGIRPMQSSIGSHSETWIYADSNGNERGTYEVNVRLGESLDVTSL